MSMPDAMPTPPSNLGRADAGGRSPWRLDGRATGVLRDALAILAAEMHEAVARRRVAAPETEAYRNADERVAYLVDLFRQLQDRMVIPAEVWHLRRELAQ
ncbi:MAG: hypothetical protein M0Z49_07875 [Chloroflexi bacterium]|nr:hypothetical protein [Chloroflexota bacterium]MDA8236893.1 hypothetical protein [Chloroflexota bacterium]